MSQMQLSLFAEQRPAVRPFRCQLLKWVGSKQRFAHEIVSYFPRQFNTYYEPFLGSAAVLGTLAPPKAVGSDCFAPLMRIWKTLHSNPNELKEWYDARWSRMMEGNKVQVYEEIKASYNSKPNSADLLFLCRACYGGIVRFRRMDGCMSTPCGAHAPISPAAFSRRVDQWYRRTQGAVFRTMDYAETMNMARPGDLVYCDPPYRHSQGILYGAQGFDLKKLLTLIGECKSRGVYVALSIDGRNGPGDSSADYRFPTVSLSGKPL